MPDKLTMQGIARLAGISKVTVSRVLNHNPSVKSLLRERVHLVVGHRVVLFGLSQLVYNAVSILSCKK